MGDYPALNFQRKIYKTNICKTMYQSKNIYQLELDSIKPNGTRVIEIILRQMKSMDCIQWMVNAWGKVKTTPVQSVEDEQS